METFFDKINKLKELHEIYKQHDKEGICVCGHYKIPIEIKDIKNMIKKAKNMFPEHQIKEIILSYIRMTSMNNIICGCFLEEAVKHLEYEELKKELLDMSSQMKYKFNLTTIRPLILKSPNKFKELDDFKKMINKWESRKLNEEIEAHINGEEDVNEIKKFFSKRTLKLKETIYKIDYENLKQIKFKSNKKFAINATPGNFKSYEDFINKAYLLLKNKIKFSIVLIDKDYMDKVVDEQRIAIGYLFNKEAFLSISLAKNKYPTKESLKDQIKKASKNEFDLYYAKQICDLLTEEEVLYRYTNYFVHNGIIYQI